MFFKARTIAIAAFALCLTICNVQGQTKIKDYCRIRGMERHILRGFGIVTGLQGTGASNEGLMTQKFAEAMLKSGFPISRKTNGEVVAGAIGETKNSCFVAITVDVPATGASIGDQLRVKVSTFDKTTSLKGGRLIETALTGGPAPSGPRQTIAGNAPILAIAAGGIELEGDTTTSGVIEGGARIEHEIRNKYYEDRTDSVEVSTPDGLRTTKEKTVRYLNLVVKNAFAETGWNVASRIADRINTEINGKLVTGRKERFAEAIDAKNIRVRFVPAYYNEPAVFARYITEEIDVFLQSDNKTVVINARKGVISIGKNVTFEPVAFFDGEFKVDVSPFKALTLDDAEEAGNGRMKLQALVNAFNQIDAPPEKIIEVIKQLEDSGVLYGRVIMR